MSSRSLSGLSTRVYADAAALGTQHCGHHDLFSEGHGLSEESTIDCHDYQSYVLRGHSGEPITHMPVNLMA